MRKLLKRFAAVASAVVIGGVSCVTTWFSVPVVAFGAVDLYNVFQLFQMLTGVVMPHIHLDGDGPDSSGNYYYTVQDWWDDNFVKKYHYDQWDADLTAYDDLMYRMWDTLGVDDMVKLVDSWNEVYDDGYAGVADVGTDVSLSSSFGQLSDDGSCYRVTYPSSGGHISSSSHSIWFQSPSSPLIGTIVINFFLDHNGVLYAFMDSSSANVYLSSHSNLGIVYSWVTDSPSGYLFQSISSDLNNTYYHFYQRGTWDASMCAPYVNVIRSNGHNLIQSDCSYLDYLSKFSDVVFSGSDSDAFIGPVFSTPAAQQLAKEQGTLTGIRLDVQTDTGAPDIDAALNHAGVDTVDDLINGVAKGDIPMSQVYADTKVVPYVLTDVDTGKIVTDLTVPATAANVKSVALDKDLAIPKDITAADAYEVKGKTWDPEMSKYRLPLFQYFPFCLPWDIYQVLAAFSADPVAPVFDVPVGKILSGVHSADVSKAASVSAKINFGDDNWSKVFEIIRILECAGIIVGLCLVAVYLIHGGR